MLVADTVRQKILTDDEIKETYASRQPYGEWLDQHMMELKDLKIPNKKVEQYTKEECARLRKAFGYSYEEYHDSIRTMALNGTEGITSMGVDTRLRHFPTSSHCCSPILSNGLPR